MCKSGKSSVGKTSIVIKRPREILILNKHLFFFISEQKSMNIFDKIRFVPDNIRFDYILFK